MTARRGLRDGLAEGDEEKPALERPKLGAADARERELHYDALFETMSEGFALCEGIRDNEGRLTDYTILEMNPALMRMLGVGPEAVGTKLSDGRWNSKEWLALCQRVLKTGKSAGFEYHHARTDLWHEVRITRVTETRMAQLFFDITERKKAEARQADLFDELNHRVKNNLALVASILGMKARATDNEVVRDQLLKAVSRVHSISQVHSALYKGARKDEVDFGVYLRELCTGISQSLVHDDRISVEVEAEPIMVAVDTAIPLGMVVNELVTNAVKYAYPPPSRGSISVRFRRDGQNLLLVVDDQGRGLPSPGQDRSGGLGMKLVGSLVAQVQGQLAVRRHPGAGFEIRLPADPEG